MRTASVRGHDRIGSLREVSADQLATVRLCERKPVTLWQVASELGDDRAERASVILQELMADGTLARYRAGLSDYYAAPREALTGHGPGPAAVLVDSLRSLVLACRYRGARRLPLNTEVTGLQNHRHARASRRGVRTW